MPAGAEDDEKEGWEEISKNKFLGRVFIKKACRIRYGKLMDELHHGIPQGWNGYPDDLDEGYNML
eukprot:12871513-Ditylum_brightwellii.AAC.1